MLFFSCRPHASPPKAVFRLHHHTGLCKNKHKTAKQEKVQKINIFERDVTENENAYVQRDVNYKFSLHVIHNKKCLCTEFSYNLHCFFSNIPLFSETGQINRQSKQRLRIDSIWKAPLVLFHYGNDLLFQTVKAFCVFFQNT